jgi:hypothetical protein
VEEAVTAAKAAVEKPQFGRRADQTQIGETIARDKVRLGQALLGADRRSEALAPLQEAVNYYRQELAKGAGETGFRQDSVRAFYQLALAQAGDEAGRIRRRELLDEAAALLDGLSFEGRQLVASKELNKWVIAAQAQARE